MDDYHLPIYIYWRKETKYDLKIRDSKTLIWVIFDAIVEERTERLFKHEV